MTKKITKAILFGVQKQQLKHLTSSNWIYKGKLD